MSLWWTIVKIAILLKLTSWFNTIPVKIPNASFIEIGKLILWEFGVFILTPTSPGWRAAFEVSAPFVWEQCLFLQPERDKSLLEEVVTCVGTVRARRLRREWQHVPQTAWCSSCVPLLTHFSYTDLQWYWVYWVLYLFLTALSSSSWHHVAFSWGAPSPFIILTLTLSSNTSSWKISVSVKSLSVIHLK